MHVDLEFEPLPLVHIDVAEERTNTSVPDKSVDLGLFGLPNEPDAFGLKENDVIEVAYRKRSYKGS